MSSEGNKEGAAAGEVTRPEGLADAYWDGEANAVRFDAVTKDLSELTGLREFKTAADARTAALPKAPADYKFELPKEFKLPDGQKLDPEAAKDPLFTMLRDIAHKNGVSQEAFSEGLAQIGQMRFEADKAALAAEQQALDAETAALGEKAAERRDALRTQFASLLPKDSAGILEAVMDTKAGVEFLEAVRAQITGTTARGHSQGGANTKDEELEALADGVGKPGGAMALLRHANTKKAA